MEWDLEQPPEQRAFPSPPCLQSNRELMVAVPPCHPPPNSQQGEGCSRQGRREADTGQVDAEQGLEWGQTQSSSGVSRVRLDLEQWRGVEQGWTQSDGAGVERNWTWSSRGRCRAGPDLEWWGGFRVGPDLGMG